MTKLLMTNLAESATLSGATDALFPLSNIQDARRTKIATNNATTMVVVFDFGSAKTVDCFATIDAVSRQLNATSILLEMNSSDSWGSPAFSQAITLYPATGLAYEFFAPQTYRYARVTVTAPGNAYLGKVFLGEAFNLLPDFAYPLTYSVRQLGSRTSNLAGQFFVDVAQKQKLFSSSVNGMIKEEFEDLITQLNPVSTIRPLWVIFETLQALDDQNTISGYYFLADEPQGSLSLGNIWSLPLSFVEGL